MKTPITDGLIPELYQLDPGDIIVKLTDQCRDFEGEIESFKTYHKEVEDCLARLNRKQQKENEQLRGTLAEGVRIIQNLESEHGEFQPVIESFLIEAKALAKGTE